MSEEIGWQHLAQVATYIAEEAFKIVQGPVFSWTANVVTPGYEEPHTVEGSIVDPITDPARLLESKEIEQV